jgi:ElaB/YqjD/DUF883 family membrane-anchored ribosome-binding protein
MIERFISIKGEATMAQATQNDSSEELAAVKADLKQLKTDMAALVAALKESGAQRASAVEDSALDAVHEAISTLNRRFEGIKTKAGTQAKDALDEAEQTVVRHPLATVAAAFGIGFVLAKLFDVGSRR